MMTVLRDCYLLADLILGYEKRLLVQPALPAFDTSVSTQVSSLRPGVKNGSVNLQVMNVAPVCQMSKKLLDHWIVDFLTAPIRLQVSLRYIGGMV